MEKWWKEAVGYQVYLKSFKDSTGDGIGDLKGLISKLDYLKDLGINLIWLSPMYESPNDDNGYDISDYQKISTDYGDMNDFDQLLNECHKRGIKLIIDLVINHTSDEHPWFIESKSSLNNPKRDWYIWQDPKDGKEPNNWESIFKGSAWEYDENTKQYYLHLFAKKQPDLNWENPEVREELYKMVNWWLDKGVDGFRVDAISHIKKEDGFPDMPNPKGLDYVDSFDMHMNRPGIHKYLKELKEKTFNNYDIVTVGEANGVNSDDEKDLNDWIGENDGKFNMVFQFEHLKLWDIGDKNSFDVIKYKKVLSRWQEKLDKVGWNALYIENHDLPRIISLWGDDDYREQSAKAFATTYFLQKGTPFIYQGQEIGMTNPYYDHIDDYQDVSTQNEYYDGIKAGNSPQNMLDRLKLSSRCNSRSPIQWNDKLNSGFTRGKPWSKVNNNYSYVNVENEQNNHNSVLNYYKELINLRKNCKTLVYGKYELILENHDKIYAYTRSSDEAKYLIINNLSKDETKFKSGLSLNQDMLILSNYNTIHEDNIKEFSLKAYESRVYRIK